MYNAIFIHVLQHQLRDFVTKIEKNEGQLHLTDCEGCLYTLKCSSSTVGCEFCEVINGKPVEHDYIQYLLHVPTRLLDYFIERRRTCVSSFLSQVSETVLRLYRGESVTVEEIMEMRKMLEHVRSLVSVLENYDYRNFRKLQSKWEEYTKALSFKDVH